MIKILSTTLLLFSLLGCTIQPEAKTTEKTQTVVEDVKKEIETVRKKPTLPAGFKEEKKLRPIGANVPETCQEWSDGCNSCTRAGNKQASCTIYTCENKAPFSCLKWQ